MGSISASLCIMIGAIFASSSTAKAFDFAGFRRVLQYTLRVSRPTASTLGAAVLAAESVVALSGLASAAGLPARYFDLGLATVLMVAFTGWTLRLLRGGLAVSCPCFGSQARVVSWRTVIRNILVLATIVVALTWTAPPAWWLSPARQIVLTGAVSALATGVTAYRFARPHLMTARKTRGMIIRGPETEGSAA